MGRRLSYVVGVDDAPFEPGHRGDVPLVGAVCNGPRLEGVVTGKARRDGTNATSSIERMIAGSRFTASLQAVLLQGVTVAGFNVVDVPALAAALGLPVVAVCRRRPDRDRIRGALLGAVPGGARKWRLIETLGDPRRCGSLYLHAAGIDWREAERLVTRLAVHSRLPEPLRTAHLIAGALVHGESRHRA